MGWIISIKVLIVSIFLASSWAQPGGIPEISIINALSKNISTFDLSLDPPPSGCEENEESQVSTLLVKEQLQIVESAEISRNFYTISLLLEHFIDDGKIEHTVAVSGLDIFKELLSFMRSEEREFLVVLNADPRIDHINLVYVGDNKIMILEPTGLQEDSKSDFINPIVKAVRNSAGYETMPIYVNREKVQTTPGNCGFMTLAFLLEICKRNQSGEIFSKFINSMILSPIDQGTYNIIPTGSIRPEIAQYTQSHKRMVAYEKARTNLIDETYNSSGSPTQKQEFRYLNNNFIKNNKGVVLIESVKKTINQALENLIRNEFKSALRQIESMNSKKIDALFNQAQSFGNVEKLNFQ